MLLCNWNIGVLVLIELYDISGIPYRGMLRQWLLLEDLSVSSRFLGLRRVLILNVGTGGGPTSCLKVDSLKSLLMKMNPGAPRPKDGAPLLLAPNDNSGERAAPSDGVPGPSVRGTGDRQTASDTRTFLLELFKLYPEFPKNPFYIAGESYGGVYTATLGSELVKGITANVKPEINFKGYMVGNAKTNTEIDDNSVMSFAHDMGLISDDLYQVG
ncbi:hypothetical protein AgCh_004458 [Apium graveolens]